MDRAESEEPFRPGDRARAEYYLFVAKLDKILAEESLILEGLKQAVWRGEITEDEKHIWLNAYLDKRQNPDD